MNNKRNSDRSISQVKVLAFMSILIALDVILVRFVSFEIPSMRIGAGFIAVIIAGMYLGPLRAGIVGLVADILGMLIFPKGAFFPGFTLSGSLNYVIAGWFLEGKKSAKTFNVITYAIFSTLIIDTFLNTIWLVMMLHQNDMSRFIPVLAPRVPFQIVMTILKVILIPILYRTLFSRLKATDVERPGIRETVANDR